MAVSVLSLRDPHIRSFVRSDPRLRGAKVIGRGSFCRVFETSDPNRVFKLTADSIHAAYLVDRYAPQGVFKPVVHEDFEVVCETRSGVTVRLLEIEKLQKIHRTSPNRRLVRRICDFVFRVRGARMRFPAPEDELPWLPPDLALFMSQVNDFCETYDCKVDAHAASFMERADGSLVLSDPVYDYRTYSEHI